MSTDQPNPRRCDGCGRGLAVYTVPPGQAPRGVTYVCLDCAGPTPVAGPRWDWKGTPIEAEPDPLTEEVRMLLLTRQEAIEILTAERDAYRAFAVRLGGRFAPPDAEDMIARTLATCDLDDLADTVLTRVDAADALVDREVADRLAGPRRPLGPGPEVAGG